MARHGCRLAAAWLTGLTWVGAPAQAHDPNVATFELEEGAAGWVLEGSFMFSRAQATLEAEDPDLDWAAVDRVEIERRLMDHLRVTVEIWADGVGVPLGAGGIRLGDHQTTVRFPLPALGDGPSTLTVGLHSFADNPEQTQVLRIYHDGRRHTRVLRAEEDFTTRVDLAEAESPRVQPAPRAPGTPEEAPEGVPVGPAAGAGALLGGTALVALRRRGPRAGTSGAPAAHGK